MAEDVEINLSGLKQLEKVLKQEGLRIRIGILGDGAARDGALSNAEIGAIHEFGSKNLPQRSFLRIPLSDHLMKAIEDSGAFDKDALKKVLASGSAVPYAKKIAIIAEAVVAEGFASGGYGKWAPSQMDNKKVQQTLVETQQLRNSITSEVKEKA